MSAWNDFVKKIYWEEKKKNPNFQFKEALSLASKRKGEMGASAKTPTAMGTKKHMKKSKKSKKGGRKTRRARKH
jgi:hypothetical protein